MSQHRLICIMVVLTALAGCSSRSDAPVREEGSVLPDEQSTYRLSAESGGHVQALQKMVFDPASGQIEIVPDRVTSTHLDLAYFYKYYPDMLKFEVVNHNPEDRELALEITFMNPLDKALGDVRAIFPTDGDVLPVDFDGWSVRAGAPPEDPDPYFAFGRSFTKRMIEPEESDSRTVTFRYDPPLGPLTSNFVLDATVDNNTAEAYDFGVPLLTGRLFHIAISDWQDDISSVVLDARPCGLPEPLRLAPFGNANQWGTSIPDIPDGDYSMLLTVESPETEGEIGEDEPAVAVQWVHMHWPPDEPVIPLPQGQGIYGYSFIDPDTNLPPTNGQKFMEKFTDEMGGEWMIIEYGEICNSGYLAMHEWTPQYVEWIHEAAPDLPIHLNFDNLGFTSRQNDPCQHGIENYTPAFFNHLLESIRQQVLENPDYECVSGLHFDIEVFPAHYTEEELFAIYRRYGDFLARLHLEPDLDGRNITLYEFDRHPHRARGDLCYLCTTDAFLGACYYTRFTWDWVTDGHASPFYQLEKLLGNYHTWAIETGRPYYPILGTFSGWIDAMQDTLPNLTPCGPSYLRLIDDYCFGKGDFATINEFDIVRAQDVHGMEVEQVLLRLPSGEAIFPANGLVVYLLGDGNPQTISDDTVFCRTAYGMAKACRLVSDADGSLIPGSATFRFENNSYWKAAAQSRVMSRGDITAISGKIRFSDGLDIRLHPELWGEITIELLDPLTPEILDNPAYRTSIDIVGVVDGNYIFPDLPRAEITIRAVADGWVSDPIALDMTRSFDYRENIDLVLHPSG